MEDGLETSSIGSSVKHGLDLNKDPVEQMEPALTLTMTLTMTDSVSRKDLDLNESVGVECETSFGCDAPNGVKVEGIIYEAVEEERQEQVKLPDDGLYVLAPPGERKHEEGAAIENGEVIQNENNVAVKVKGRRGRKKKVVKQESKDGASFNDDTLEKVFFSNDLVSAKDDLVISSPGRQTEVGSHDSAGDKNNANGENKPEKRRRGRKRKKVEASECHNDDVTADEQVDSRNGENKISLGKSGRGRKRKNGMPLTAQSKRVLRSGTVAVIDGKKHVYGVNDTNLSRPNTVIKVYPSEKKTLEGSNDDTARPIERKPRRGRPPKMQGKNEISRPTSGKKRGPKKSASYESKQLLVNQSNGVEEKDTDQVNAEANNRGSEDDGNKGLGGDAHHVKKCKWKRSKRAKESGRREQQQVIRDQIKDIVLKAGWTIEYRPRLNREYNDAVYVDSDGGSYWSVTLAYRKLKEKVEREGGNDMERSAFIPIPEEVLSTLFRVRKVKKDKEKKRKMDVESKTSKKKNKEKKKQKEKNKIEISRKTVRRKKFAEDRKRRKPCALLARNGGSDGDKFILYEGKRTPLAWMIDLGVIKSNTQVHYINGERKKAKLQGKITGDGIFCSCCGKTLSLAEFESHAGSKLSQPFQNVILESGKSLLECLVESWNKQKEIDYVGYHFVAVVDDDPNDDTCNICGDGGDLICCDSCPSTFHQSCLDIQTFPSGDWRCVYCSCKFCGTAVGESSKNDVPDGTLVPELSTCLLCEGKFHLSCVAGHGALDFEPKDQSFCGKGCQKIFEGIQALLGVRHEMEEGFCWRLLQHRDFDRDINSSNDLVQVECNCKLAVASSIMNECFVPMVDQRSKINVIQSVMYNCGSNFKRLNYNGFYTVILEKGDEIISAASIRIHGNQVVEMPFIGTRYIYRRQGMCRRLLKAIETALSPLGVEKLVIPAVLELIETWTKVFGFASLEKSHRQEMKHMNMMVFPGTDMLQKPLLKDESSEAQLTSTGYFSGSNADALSEVKLNPVDKGGEGQKLTCSLVVPETSIYDEKAIQCLEESKEAMSCVLTREVGNHDEKAIQCLEESKEAISCVLTRKVGNHDANSVEAPVEKDTVASSEVTYASTGDGEASHQIQKNVELPVANGYICDKTSTSGLASLNSPPLGSRETSHDYITSKEVSVGVHVLSHDSKSLQDRAQPEACSS